MGLQQAGPKKNPKNNFQFILRLSNSPTDYTNMDFFGSLYPTTLCFWMYKKKHLVRCITMAIHGFQKVKASIMWAMRVVTTAIITQTTFLPVLSTIKPRTGDAGAEMM